MDEYNYWIPKWIYDFQTLAVLLPSVLGYFFKQWRDKRSNKKSLAAALLAEIESLESRYNYVTKGGLTTDIMVPNQQGEYTLYRLPITQDYFTVYTENASRIEIFDPDEVKAIVTFYTTAKGFIDTIMAWEQDTRKYNDKILDSMMNMTFYSNNDVSLRVKSILGDIPVRYAQILEHQTLVLSQLSNVKGILEKYNR